MTDLQRALEIGGRIIEMKKEAVRAGVNRVVYELFGKERVEYYHSGRWHGSPASVGAYGGAA